jgi:hypothetical protein
VPGIAALGVGKNLLSMPVKKGANWTGRKIRGGLSRMSGGEKNDSNKSLPQGQMRKFNSKRKGLS